MEIGLGEIVMIGILAVLLLEPKDLPRIAKNLPVPMWACGDL